MWIFKKIFRFGGFRTTVSKRGIGTSWGFAGFRVGISSDGRKYISFGIPNTGLYYIKYIKNKDSQNENIKPKPKQNITEAWWKQKDL